MAVEHPQGTPDETVLYHLEAGVALITLNRPERRNALTADMDARLREYVRQADADPRCKVIGITGAGQGFCSGADLSGPPPAAQALPYALQPQRLADFRFGYLIEAGKPVVALLNGAAVGVGLVLASFCDIRLATPEAKLGFTYSRVGLVAEYGIAGWLPHLVGAGAARELLLSGRLFAASEGQRLGLIDQLYEADDFHPQAQRYLRDLAEQCSPRSLRVIKRQCWQALQHDLLSTIVDSDQALQAARRSADHQEGLAAFREKRAPRFPGSES
ncbi:enoyl-CoA hydratase-related protein [Pseudomonas sp. A014]|uniref:enoyl-CoA hydratase-related protein n=1 Tax=Pseudomonas sp. A014 TaxID=3458058 RepID=UPI0040360001